MTSWRKMLFYSMFIAVPMGFWQWGIHPLLERRTHAQAEQENAGLQAGINKKILGERDRLEILWNDFRPQAEFELFSLGAHLDPILLQNHVLDLARRLSCELKIQSRGNREGGGLPTYSFSGSGAPWQAHEFLRYLERGDQRARFTAVTVVYSAIEKAGPMIAYFSGEFTIPSVPDELKEPSVDGNKLASEPSENELTAETENVG
jgi:hypothetical protein